MIFSACHRYVQKIKKYVYFPSSSDVKIMTILGSAQAFAALDGFFIYVLVARFVDPALFGEYKYFVSIFELSSICALSGMKISLIRSVARGFEGSLRQGFWLRVQYGYVLGIPLAAMGFYRAWQGQWPQAFLFFLLYFSIPFLYAFSLALPFLQGKKAFSSLSKIMFVSELITLTSMLLAIFFTKTSVAFFTIFFAFSLAGYIAFYIYARRHVEDQATDPQLLSHARHQSFLDVLQIIAGRIDSTILFHLLGPVELAFYAFGVLTVDQLRGLCSVIYTAIGPRFASYHLKDTLRTISQKMFMMGLLGAIVAVAYWVVAPVLYQVLFPRYVSVVAYSQVYALSLIFILPSLLGMYLLNLQDLRREATLYNLWNQGFLIVALFIGGIFYHMWGIVMARVLSSVFQLVTILWILQTKRHQLATL